MRLLLGSRGQQVREVQGLLNSKGASPRLVPDGKFGRLTDAAVRTFQRQHRLEDDGIVGNRTWNALHSRGGRPAPPVQSGFDFFDLDDLAAFFRGLTGGAPSPSPAPRPPARPAITQPAPARPPARTGGTPSPVPAIVSRSDFGNFERVSYGGYPVGRAYVIKNFRRWQYGGIQLLPSRRIVQPGSTRPSGMRNECAQFVQYFGVSNTRTWRRGPRVCDMPVGSLAEGTVIATMRDGVYHSDYSGRSHVGIYLRHDPYTNGRSSGGVWMMDQYNGAPIDQRCKYYAVDGNSDGKPTRAWTDADGVRHTNRVNWTRDGEEYYVLLTNQ